MPAFVGARADLMRAGVPAAVASSPVPPAVTPNDLAVFIGDSREQKAGGFGNGSTSRVGAGGLNLLPAFLDNIVMLNDTGNHGISSSTSDCLLKRAQVASNAWTGNPANADTNLAADANYNASSSGTLAPLGPPAGSSTPASEPGKIVFLKIGLNDQTSSYYGLAPQPKRSMQVVKLILDIAQANGQFVFLSNEVPTGRSSVQGEKQAVSGGTCTATNTIVHANAGLTAVDANGKSLGFYTNMNGTALTAPGQFNVTSGGVYTFYSTDTAATVWLYYSYGNAVAGLYQWIYHLWLQSNAANFTYTNADGSVTDYGVPGALYGRDAYVRVWNTWDAMADPSTSGANTTNKPMCYVDGKHPAMGSNLFEGQAGYAALTGAYPTLKTKDRRPVGNIVQVGVGPASSAATNLSGTLPSLRGFADGTGKIPAGSVCVLVGGIKSPADVDGGSGSGSITGSNYTATINYTTGAYTVAAAAGNIAQNATVEFAGRQANGSANLIQNGMLDPALGSGTTGMTASGTNLTAASIAAIPKGLTLLNNSAVQTAINNNLFTLTMTGGTRTLADGTVIPTFIVSGIGVIAGTEGSGSSIGFQAIQKNIANRVNFGAGGDRLRAGVFTRSLLGPDGHCYGSAVPQVKATVVSTAGVTRPLPSTSTTSNQTGSITVLTSTVGGAAAQGVGLPGAGLLDAHIPSGGLALPLVSAPVDVSLVTPSTNQCYAEIDIPFEVGRPISFQYEFSQLGFQPN